MILTDDQLKALIEYHTILEGTLRCDADENERGFLKDRDLLKKYNTLDWRRAYKNAADAHSKKAEIYSMEYEKKHGEKYILGGSFFEKNEGPLMEWVFEACRLGEDPDTPWR